jgi:hypothetical protein
MSFEKRWCNVRGIVGLSMLGLCVLVSLSIPGCGPARSPTPQKNSVAWLAQRYHVSEDKVRSVAAAIGVSPDQLGDFGPADFPLNYFAQQIRNLSNVEVRKNDFDGMMRGYEASCTHGFVFYLFYSTNLDTSPAVVKKGGEAMVLRFLFDPLTLTADGSPALDNWNIVDIRDSGFYPYMKAIQEECGIN